MLSCEPERVTPKRTIRARPLEFQVAPSETRRLRVEVVLMREDPPGRRGRISS